MKRQQQDACGDADISHIEDAGTEAADAEVHEVDHSSVVKHTIQEIADSSVQRKTPSPSTEGRHARRRDDDKDQKPHKPGSNSDLKQQRTHVVRQSGPNA